MLAREYHEYRRGLALRLAASKRKGESEADSIAELVAGQQTSAYAWLNLVEAIRVSHSSADTVVRQAG